MLGSSDDPPVSEGTINSSSKNVADLKSRLLELPAEVRLNIYQNIFKGAEIRLRVSVDLKLDCRDSNKATSILRVCRLLRAEAMPICHATALFEGSENDFELLDEFKKSYGGLADRSRLAKVVMQKHLWPSEDLESDGLVKWMERPTMLQDLTCHIVGSLWPQDERPPAHRPTYNQLYQSDSMRRAELEDLMYDWFWPPDKWRAIRDILRITSILARSNELVPRVVVYFTMGAANLEHELLVSPCLSAP
jgi:hypothetical protein